MSTNTVEAPEGVKSEQGEAKPQAKSRIEWKHMALGLAAVGLISAVTSFGVVKAMSSGGLKPRIGVIDVSEIVQIEQLRKTAAVMKEGLSEEGKKAIFEDINGFGGRLEKAIDQARAECKCELVTRQSFIGVSEFDMTKSVKERLGMGNMDLASAKALGAQAMLATMPTQSNGPFGQLGAPQ
jgi:hypothetical protein